MTGLGSSCGACKFLRRRCTSECVFAPYFCYDQAANHFAAVHKVFGASNVSKLLLHLPVHHRSEAAITISYEALARMRDPIYGCVAHVFALQQQVASLQEEIEILGNQMTNTAFDGQSCGSFQATHNQNNGFQFHSQGNDMNVSNCLNQQTPLLSPTETRTASQAFYSHANPEFTPAYGWEDQASHSTSDTYLSELLFQGMDQGIFYPWMCNGTNTLS
ncbi:hypothetical protein RJ640_009379 [Escallonia rubra]|uniref:LOB domain-containing protein n=1 Tax=Escallonia rubra TaxID=112253 RepID=A0AA88U2B3_9ASTE|nr:hypothetical protein RJ640_009379 [Escallonia rubra]